MTDEQFYTLNGNLQSVIRNQSQIYHRTFWVGCICFINLASVIVFHYLG